MTDFLHPTPQETPVWLNGALVASAAARIDPADRGLLLGDGLFETLRVAQGTPRHAARHLSRLREGAALLRLDLPEADVLCEAFAAMIAAHRIDRLRAAADRDARPRTARRAARPPGNARP